ncbi:MAG: hypothetical protein H7251_19305 [Acetobacteraceae bacterium]|nr:hypothetical protein [Acetobacteraceae bacterium]
MIRAVLLLLAFATQAVAQPAARPGGGAAGDGPTSCISAPPDCVVYDDPIHRGCGTRGGPGCRKANGHCASWNDKVARDCRVPTRAAKPVAPNE